MSETTNKSADESRRDFQVGEKIETPGGPFSELHVSGFLNDSVLLENGMTLYRTQVALNAVVDGRRTKSFELELFDTRGVQTTPATSRYLRERIGELAYEREYWEELSLSQQEQAERVYWEVASRRAKDPSTTMTGLGDATLINKYLQNKESQRNFHRAKGATKQTK